ncbi:MAG: CvpA family protein [Desulfuromonadales bacterium]|jgi:membrane protein required for colicin V production
MNFLDIAILVVLVAFVVKGLLRGLLKECCSLLGLVIGAALAFRFHAPLAELMSEAFHLPAGFCVATAFVVLFLATVLFFSLISFLLTRFVKLVFLSGMNRLVGGFFGLAQGILLLAILLFAASARPLPTGVAGIYRHSQLAPPFVGLGEAAVQGSRILLANWR